MDEQTFEVIHLLDFVESRADYLGMTVQFNKKSPATKQDLKDYKNATGHTVPKPLASIWSQTAGAQFRWQNSNNHMKNISEGELHILSPSESARVYHRIKHTHQPEQGFLKQATPFVQLSQDSFLVVRQDGQVHYWGVDGYLSNRYRGVAITPLALIRYWALYGFAKFNDWKDMWFDYGSSSHLAEYGSEYQIFFPDISRTKTIFAPDIGLPDRSSAWVDITHLLTDGQWKVLDDIMDAIFFQDAESITRAHQHMESGDCLFPEDFGKYLDLRKGGDAREYSELTIWLSDDTDDGELFGAFYLCTAENELGQKMYEGGSIVFTLQGEVITSLDNW